MKLEPIRKANVTAGLYLAKVDGNFRTGRFTKEWHGWMFDDGVQFFQLDGDDGTKWGGIWKIKP